MAIRGVGGVVRGRLLHRKARREQLKLLAENSEGGLEREDISAQGDTSRNEGSGTKKRCVSRGGGKAGEAGGADGKGKANTGSTEQTAGKVINKAALANDSDDEPLFKKDAATAVTKHAVDDNLDDDATAASLPVTSSSGEEEEDDEEEDDDGEQEGAKQE